MENLEIINSDIINTELERKEKIADKKNAIKKEKLQIKKTAKKEATNVVKKKDEKLSKINFNLFADKLKGVSEYSGSKNVQKSTLYNYPENWNAMQINSDEGKNWRSARRKTLINLCNRIQSNYKFKKADLLEVALNEFKSFYKTYFRLNDFSINSITHTKNEKNDYISTTLEIVKVLIGNTPAKKAKSKK